MKILAIILLVILAVVLEILCTFIFSNILIDGFNVRFKFHKALVLLSVAIVWPVILLGHIILIAVLITSEGIAENFL